VIQDIVTDSDVRSAILKIYVPHPASISVDGYNFHSVVTIQYLCKGDTEDGQVVLSASRIKVNDDKTYIQISECASSWNGNRASGSSLHAVSPDTKLEDFFTISATNGIYKLDSPITIAQLEGKPVTLVVGKPTK
jgi:hypothetical protein